MNNDYLIQQDAAMASVASKTTLYGWVGSAYGVLSDSGLAILVGTVVTLAGFSINWYFQRRRNEREKASFELKEKREQELHEWAEKEHKARMEKLRRDFEGKCESD